MTGPSLKHEERRDDLAAYSLGALPAGEATELERHLAGCEDCAEYLSWLQPAVDLLPASVEQLEPPERLRASLMEAVRGEREPEPVVAAEPKRRRWSLAGLTLRPATVIAAAAVLVAGVAAGYLMSDSGSEREFVRAEALAPESASTLAAEVEHGAGGDAILHVERAPELAEGDVYQAWVSRDGEMEPAASFVPHEDGTAEAALGDSLDGADAVLVTEEPSPDEDQPTSAPILRAELG